MLNRYDLDLLAARGCQTPGCDHRNHDAVYLHARCHVASPLWAEYYGSALRLCCRKCRGLIEMVEATSALEPLDPPCHPGAAVAASYAVGSGVLALECHVCKAVFSRVPVAS